jgi:hypothetical protein
MEPSPREHASPSARRAANRMACWCRPDAGHRSPWAGRGSPQSLSRTCPSQGFTRRSRSHHSVWPTIIGLWTGCCSPSRRSWRRLSWPGVSSAPPGWGRGRLLSPRTGHGDSTTVGAEAPHLDEWIARRHRCPLPSASQSLRATRGARKRQVPVTVGCRPGRLDGSTVRPEPPRGAVDDGPARPPRSHEDHDTGPPILRAAIARGPSGVPPARQGRVRGVRRATPSHWRPVARRTNSSKARSNGGRPWQQHPL